MLKLEEVIEVTVDLQRQWWNLGTSILRVQGLLWEATGIPNVLFKAYRSYVPRRHR